MKKKREKPRVFTSLEDLKLLIAEQGKEVNKKENVDKLLK